MNKETLNNLYGKGCYADTDSLKEVYHSGMTHAEIANLFNDAMLELRADVKGLLHETPYKSEDIDSIYEHDLAIYEVLRKIDKFIRN